MANSQSITYAPPPTVDRRAILATFASALCIPTIAAVPMREPAPNPLDVARPSADLLAAQMQELHGGTWFATVDHDSGFALIRPKNGGPS
jgi:hypothetical protein